MNRDMPVAKENTIKCRFLLADGTLICNAGQLPYLPTDFQAEEYCRKQGHRKCPFYLESTMQEHDMAATDMSNNLEH
jgi:hypothetical protein